MELEEVSEVDEDSELEELVDVGELVIGTSVYVVSDTVVSCNCAVSIKKSINYRAGKHTVHPQSSPGTNTVVPWVYVSPCRL